MIVTPYNHHVRLLSSEPFGWFAPPKFTRGLGADIVMESFHSLTLASQTALVRIEKWAAAEQNGFLSCGQDISGTLNRRDGRTSHGLLKRAIASKYCRLRNLAERGGFEPPVQVLARTTV